MTQPITTPAGLLARFQENVRILKSLRRVSDTDIAKSAGYSSRQLLNHRMTGRTTPTIDDVARIAAALRVEPHILMLPLPDVIRWAEANPTYKSPKVGPAPTHRDARSS